MPNQNTSVGRYDDEIAELMKLADTLPAKSGAKIAVLSAAFNLAAYGRKGGAA
jgi:hypothetical protein